MRGLKRSISRRVMRKNRKTCNKRTLRKRTLRKRKQRGGRDFQSGATRQMLEQVPITDNVTVATEDGWVGSANDYNAHQEYLSNQLRVTGT